MSLDILFLTVLLYTNQYVFTNYKHKGKKEESEIQGITLVLTGSRIHALWAI